MGPINYRKGNRNTLGICGFYLLNSGGPVHFYLNHYHDELHYDLHYELLYDRKIGPGSVLNFPVNNGYTLKQL